MGHLPPVPTEEDAAVSWRHSSCHGESLPGNRLASMENHHESPGRLPLWWLLFRFKATKIQSVARGQQARKRAAAAAVEHRTSAREVPLY